MTTTFIHEDAVFNATEAEHVKLHHATKAKALALTDMLAAEYPALTLHARLDEIDTVQGWHIHHIHSEDPILITRDKKVPELADIFAACEEHEVDPEALEAAQRGGSVVPETYREIYRANGDPSSCGDWLATVLPKWQAEDWQKLERVFSDNGVDMTGKWASLPDSGQRGWFGRYRMNGRQKLEVRVMKQGFLLLDGMKHLPTEAWISRMAQRHPAVEMAETLMVAA